MPRMLFEHAALGSAGSTSARRRGLSLPASVVVHAVVLIVFLLAPLVEPLRAPTPVPTAALAAYVVSLPEIAVPRPRRAAPVEVAQAAAHAAPSEAPAGIRPETGVEVDSSALRSLTSDTAGLVVGAEHGLPDAPVPPAPPPPDEPVHIGGNIRAPERIVYVAPLYPPVAQTARVEGVVIIEATISRGGDVVDARVLRSAPLLAEAALAAVRRWRYTPTLLNGVPVPVIMTVTVHFTLRDWTWTTPTLTSVGDRGGWRRTGARRRARPSAVVSFLGLSTGGLSGDRTRRELTDSCELRG